MKIKSLLFIFIFSFSISALHSQNNNHNCGSHDGYLDEQKQKYPNFYKSLEIKNLQLEDQNAKLLTKINSNNKSTDKKIIPVVVHVIHNFGSENVTDAQVNDAIRILNDNINGQDEQQLELFSYQ